MFMQAPFQGGPVAGLFLVLVSVTVGYLFWRGPKP